MKYPQSIRLRKGRDFDEVFRTGFRVHGELVRLLCLKAEKLKVGVAVGKRQANACGRSRGKRVLREVMRRLLPFVEPNMKIVVTLRDCALNAKASAVYDDAAKALKKRGFLSANWQESQFF